MVFGLFSKLRQSKESAQENTISENSIDLGLEVDSITMHPFGDTSFIAINAGGQHHLVDYQEPEILLHVNGKTLAIETENRHMHDVLEQMHTILSQEGIEVIAAQTGNVLTDKEIDAAEMVSDEPSKPPTPFDQIDLSGIMFKTTVTYSPETSTEAQATSASASTQQTEAGMAV